MNRYQLVGEMAEDLKSKPGDEISSIVLFGSVAKGESYYDEAAHNGYYSMFQAAKPLLALNKNV